MGGYGALLLAETFPGFVRSVAAFSPAVTPGDAVFSGAGWHNFGYWSTVIPSAFDFVAATLVSTSGE
jgi:S-formylglutathione hydrolase FrmB